MELEGVLDQSPASSVVPEVSVGDHLGDDVATGGGLDRAGVDFQAEGVCSGLTKFPVLDTAASDVELLVSTAS